MLTEPACRLSHGEGIADRCVCPRGSLIYRSQRQGVIQTPQAVRWKHTPDTGAGARRPDPLHTATPPPPARPHARTHAPHVAATPISPHYITPKTWRQREGHRPLINQNTTLATRSARPAPPRPRSPTHAMTQHANTQTRPRVRRAPLMATIRHDIDDHRLVRHLS